MASPSCSPWNDFASMMADNALALAHSRVALSAHRSTVTAHGTNCRNCGACSYRDGRCEYCGSGITAAPPPAPVYGMHDIYAVAPGLWSHPSGPFGPYAE